MRTAFASLALLCCSICSSAQVVTIKKVELNGERIIVHYDLEDSNPNNEYLLNLYASKDNFATPLTKVAGDVGMDIKPGSGKKMEWNILQEYGGYKGKLSLEVRGKVYVPFVRIHGFQTSKVYRRGKSYPLTWKPGNTNPISIELYKGGQRVGGDVNQPNSGSYTLYVPTHAKTGKDYKLKITNTRNTDEIIYTNSFRVGPKIPLLLKVVPVAVAGALIAVLASRKPPVETVDDFDIVDPIFP